MEVKEYLSQIRLNATKIKTNLKELENLKELALTLGGFNFTEKVQTSGTGDNISKTVARIVDYQNEVNDDINTFLDLKKDIVKKINRLENEDQIELLYKRYVEFKAWELIAVEMYYSIRQVHNIHGIALEEMKKLH